MATFHERLQQRLEKIRIHRPSYRGVSPVEDEGKKSTLAYFARRMRDEPTPAELRLWRKLRRPPMSDYGFLNQWIINRFIVDFYCPMARLIIEVDGPSHASSRSYDRSRDENLRARRYNILRFSNAQVLHDLPTVLLAIEYAILNIRPDRS